MVKALSKLRITDDNLPTTRPFNQALAIYLRRFRLFLVVVASNILLIGPALFVNRIIFVLWIWVVLPIAIVMFLAYRNRWKRFLRPEIPKRFDIALRPKELAGLILTFLLGVLTNVATSALPNEWKPYLWISWVPLIICFVLIAGLQFVHLTSAEAYIHYVAAPTAQQRRNRQAMLGKVRAIWIEGPLERSLANELHIALELTVQPDAVEPPPFHVGELNGPPQSLPPGTSILNLFDEMKGELLILGGPAAGKTTLLLELARDLIERAEQDEKHPIPVVFNLSSWTTKGQPLKQWLVEKLNTTYGMQRIFAEEWTEREMVLLLDGLDEVTATLRNDCVQAINQYRQEYPLVPLAVCSRVAEYETLTTKLQLNGAVLVQPLTPPQIEAYLKRAGEKLAAVRLALREDAELAELLNTPLMLHIMTLVYQDRFRPELQSGRTLQDRRRRLFNAYIETMFEHHSRLPDNKRQEITLGLSWLASEMMQHNQTVFSIDQMQTRWLPLRDFTSILEFSTERAFLRKVEGGYIFDNRLLLEHFASLSNQ